MSVALSHSFVEQMSRLPDQARKKVTEFLGKFMTNPESPGINYEIVKGSQRNSLHSVRIDRDYRGIIGRPGKDIWLLLWVDKHDDAYAWARGRRCEVNPQTGSLQVFLVEESTEESGNAQSALSAQVQASATQSPKNLFEAFQDRELLRVGVPSDQLSQIRALATDEDLEALLPSLPAEISDALYMMAAGSPFQEVLEHLDYKPEPEAIDISDVSAALQRHESQRLFKVLESESELIAMMGASLEAWRIFLHPTQRKLVERDWNGPVRVLGGAGTGKTVAAMHRVRWLLQNRFTGRDQRILFTTFTKNLAIDIREQLKRLIPDQMDRVEVIHLDAWVDHYLREQRLGLRLSYEGENSDYWKKALAERDGTLDLPSAFYRDEWEQIIQAQGIETPDAYFTARRIGRGTSLTASQRKSVWRVFGSYRASLEANNLIETDDAMRLVAKRMESSGEHPEYACVIVDEAQDLGFQAYRLLRKIAGPQRANDLFLVGDPNQRIYGKQASLNKSGIEIRGRSRKLRINYRTTEEIRKAAVQALHSTSSDDLDDGRDDQKGYHSLMHGPAPLKFEAKDFAAEVRFLHGHLEKARENGIMLSHICIVARTRDYCDQLIAQLGTRGWATQIIEANGSNNHPDAVNFATMHRVKGLEFDQVILVGLGADRFPMPTPAGLDDVAREKWASRERSLMYVAMTRARREVVLCVRNSTH